MRRFNKANIREEKQAASGWQPPTLTAADANSPNQVSCIQIESAPEFPTV